MVDGTGTGSDGVSDTESEPDSGIEPDSEFVTVCDDIWDRPEPITPPPGDTDPMCTEHADCTDGLNGRCINAEFDFEILLCDYDRCMTNDDCPGGSICACDGGHRGNNICIPANCETDEDCGIGGDCRAEYAYCDEQTGRYCRTPEDECTEDSDCPPDDDGSRGVCMMGDQGHFECGVLSCYD